MPNELERVPLRSIFRVFFMIGATSFGGGLISWVHRETVLERHWLTNEQFLRLELRCRRCFPAPMSPILPSTSSKAAWATRCCYRSECGADATVLRLHRFGKHLRFAHHGSRVPCCARRHSCGGHRHDPAPRLRRRYSRLSSYRAGADGDFGLYLHWNHAMAAGTGDPGARAAQRCARLATKPR